MPAVDPAPVVDPVAVPVVVVGADSTVLVVVGPVAGKVVVVVEGAKVVGGTVSAPGSGVANNSLTGSGKGAVVP